MTAQLRGLQPRAAAKRKKAPLLERQAGPVKVQVLSAVGGVKASGGQGCGTGLRGATSFSGAAFHLPLLLSCLSPVCSLQRSHTCTGCVPAEAARAFLQQRMRDKVKRSNDMLRPTKGFWPA